MRVDVLLDDPAAIRAVRLAFRQYPGIQRTCILHQLLSWAELDARADEGDFDVAVVQPTFASSGPPRPDGVQRLGRLQGKSKPGSLIPFVCRSARTPALLQELASLRFPIVLVQGIDDDPRSILRALSRAKTFRMVQAFPSRPSEKLDLSSLELVLSIIAGWPPAASVEELAQRRNLSPRTLRRRMATGDLPTPRRLSRWGRLLETFALWEMGIRSRGRIASILELGSASTLAHLSRDLTGDRLDQVLQPGQWERLLIAFFEDLTT